MLFKQPIVLFLTLSILILALSSPAISSEINEAELKKKYEAFVETLDTAHIARDYPKAVAQLDSEDPDTVVDGMRTLASTENAAVIPWIVPVLDSDNSMLRLQAGMYISKLVQYLQLKRRDFTVPGPTIVIKPLAEGDLDLRPMAWVVMKMFRDHDDGNTHSYAACMVGYLGLKQFEPELRRVMLSRHPAVTRAALYAYDMLGLNPPQNAELYQLRSTDSSIQWLMEDQQKINKGRFDIAYSLIQKEEYEEALKLLKANIQSTPDAGNADYWYGWAVVCTAHLGRYEEMLEYYGIMRTRHYGWIRLGANGAIRNWDARLATARKVVENSQCPGKAAILIKMKALDEVAKQKLFSKLQLLILKAGDGDLAAAEQLKSYSADLVDLIVEGRLVLKNRPEKIEQNAALPVRNGPVNNRWNQK